MSVFKMIILFGVLTLGLGSDICEQCAKEIPAQPNQNDQSNPDDQNAWTLQQNANEPSTSQITIPVNADINQVTAQVNQLALNTKKLENAVKKSKFGKTKLMITKKFKEELSHIDDTAAEVLHTMYLEEKKKAKDAKNLENHKCGDYLHDCMNGYDPILSFTFVLMAFIMNYLRRIIDKYGLDKQHEREHQENASE